MISSVSGMDLVLVVAEPSRSGLSDLERLVKTAETFQTKLAVCVNKWDVSPEYTRAIQEFCVEKGIPLPEPFPMTTMRQRPSTREKAWRTSTVRPGMP